MSNISLWILYACQFKRFSFGFNSKVNRKSSEILVIASSKRLAEKNQAKKNPENWNLNQKTKFRRSWRAKHAKDLNSRDPKVSTPIRLTLQQLENWEKGNGPFPESLKNELK